MSDVGGILYDQDAVYVDVPGVYTRAADVVHTLGSEGATSTKRAAAEDDADDGELAGASLARGHARSSS